MEDKGRSLSTDKAAEQNRPKGPPPLLGWQVLFLGYVLGVLGWQHAIPALVAAFLLLLVDSTRQAATRFIPFSLCFALGIAAGWAVQPPAPPLMPTQLLDTKEKIQVQGRVASVESRPGQRLHIRLENVVCRVAENDIALPGKLLWTWEHPTFWPEPGAILRVAMAVAPVRSFANPGGWDYESYLARDEIYFRAFTSADKAPPQVLQPGAAPLWRWRQQLRSATLAAMGGAERSSPGCALLLAFLYGDRFLLDPTTLDLMQRASLSHTLALSGQNIGYVVFFGVCLAWIAGALWPALFLKLPRPKLAVLIAGPLAIIYLWLGGAPPSLVRAFVMYAFWGALLWRGRSHVLLDGLFLALLCMLAVAPDLVYDLGLQLSAGAVAGLALYLDCRAWRRDAIEAWATKHWTEGIEPRLERIELYRLWRQRRIALDLATRPAPGVPFRRRRSGPGQWARRLLAGAWELLCLSLAAQLAILPLIVWTFGQLSPQFYLNVLWLPFQGFLVQPLGMVAMCLLPWPSLAAPLFDWAAALLDAGVWVLAWLDTHGHLEPYIPLRPDWPAWVGYWTLALWAVLLLRAKTQAKATSRRAALVGLPLMGLLLLAWPTLETLLADARGNVVLTLLDVGQGQSLVLEYPYGRRLVLDGGGLRTRQLDVGAAVVLPFLTFRRPPRVDRVVLSHPDTDHLRGLLYPLRVADIRAFASSGFPTDGPDFAAMTATLAARAIPAQTWKAGQRIVLHEGLALEVLHPAAGFAALTTNESSLVLRLVWNGVGLALLPGDAEKRVLDMLLEQDARLSGGQGLAAQVLLLPHHGSGKELSEEFYARVAPRLALASAGYHNQWNLPAPAVRAALASRGILLEVTAERGAVTVRWPNPDHFTLEGARDARR